MWLTAENNTALINTDHIVSLWARPGDETITVVTVDGGEFALSDKKADPQPRSDLRRLNRYLNRDI